MDQNFSCCFHLISQIDCPLIADAYWNNYVAAFSMLSCQVSFFDEFVYWHHIMILFYLAVTYFIDISLYYLYKQSLVHTLWIIRQVGGTWH